MSQVEQGFTEQEWNEGAKACSRFVKSIWQERPNQTPSEYAEKKRILPIGTPFPGPWKNRRTPYLIEPMDNMSPLSPIQQTIIMKGGQIGFTAAAENVLAYWMDVFPAEILFISATESLLKKWAVKRLDPLIDGCGFRDKIFSQSTNKGSRRTGDTIFTKEYPGGSLDMASAQAAASMRADTNRVLIRDEIDGAPRMLKTGEGNWLQVSYVRTNAWGDRRKVLDFSTPGTYDESNIWPAYQAGDQRRFFVPCPLCGKYQILEFGTDKSAHGLKWETKAGYLDSAYYLCEFCRDAFFNEHKTDMLDKGRWEPTSRSYSPYVRSYQLSTLYSPVGMTTWREIALEFLKAQDDPDGMRSFRTLYEGFPHRELGITPKLADVVSEHRGIYKSKEVPDGVLFITAGIDVQQGSEKDDKNPPRLELEFCGHGDKFRTWSIDYKVIPGEVDDESAGAWLALEEFARDGGFTFYRDDGFEFDTSLVFIDSGFNTATVYAFTMGWANTFPTKGFTILKKQKTEKGDEMVPGQYWKRYRPKNIAPGITLYEISTNYYKAHLYANLNKKRADGSWEDQPGGFPDFPTDYGEEYFRQLLAEEMHRDKSFHLKKDRPNEALDCRVLNLCAGDVFLGLEIDDWREKFRQQGMPKDQLENVNHRMILDFLIQETARLVVVDTEESDS
jgi:phage terminase large subunit GpA-like protein